MKDSALQCLALHVDVHTIPEVVLQALKMYKSDEMPNLSSLVSGVLQWCWVSEAS